MCNCKAKHKINGLCGPCAHKRAGRILGYQIQFKLSWNEAFKLVLQDEQEETLIEKGVSCYADN